MDGSASGTPDGRHGPANDVNAHPHTDAKGDVAVAHNGIIDNAATLRAGLAAAGVDLVSDTDTEVLAHLVARSAADTLEGKVAEALAQVQGTYGRAVMHADFADRLVVARQGSPLIIGVGQKEMHVASDLAALVRYTTTVAHLDDGEIATITTTGFTTYRADLSATNKAARRLDPDEFSEDDYDTGEHGTYLRKEILEQPAAAERVLRGRLDERLGTAQLGGLNMDPPARRGRSGG